MKKQSLLISCVSLALTAVANAQITDFSQWTLVEDPAHPQMSASQSTVSATLTAASGGTIPHATDIGFASVNGPTFTGSNFGYGFDPAANFKIKIDYDLGFLGSQTGGLVLGFGVGEDIDGTNSVGVALQTLNGVNLSLGFSDLSLVAVSRTNDVTALPNDFNTNANADFNGSLFVEYVANTGTFFLGVGALGDTLQSESIQFAGLQNGWNDAVLIPNIFLRSDNIGGLGLPYSTTGQGEVVFTNFSVLEGTALRAVPEPATYAALFGAAALALALRRRTTRR